MFSAVKQSSVLCCFSWKHACFHVNGGKMLPYFQLRLLSYEKITIANQITHIYHGTSVIFLFNFLPVWLSSVTALCVTVRPRPLLHVAEIVQSAAGCCRPIRGQRGRAKCSFCVTCFMSWALLYLLKSKIFSVLTHICVFSSYLPFVIIFICII